MKMNSHFTSTAVLKQVRKT